MSTLNEEVTLEVEVEYTCISKGRPESGPTYSCGGEPAEPPEFEIIVRCNGMDITQALSDDQMDDIREAVETDWNCEPDSPDLDDDDY